MTENPRMTKKFLGGLAAAVAVGMVGAPRAGAAIIAEYGFGTDHVATVEDLNVTSQDANVTATALSGTNVGTFGTGWGVSTTVGNPRDSLFQRNVPNKTFDSTKYFSFTVTPTAGYQMNLTDLNFDCSLTSDYADKWGTWQVRTSVDGFVADVGSAITLTAPSTAWTTKTIDLSGPAFQGLGSLEVRLYTSASETSSNLVLRTDNITLGGGVVPEPAALALLGLGAAALLRRRKGG